MRNKKILSALIALTMTVSMTAVSVSAEDDAPVNDETTPVAEETQAPEPTQEETQAPETDAETQPPTEAPASTKEDKPDTTASETVIDETTTTLVMTTAPETTTVVKVTTAENTESKATTTTSAKSTEKVSDKLKAPTMGEFKVSESEDEDGETAVIAWNPVEGADGYQVYRVIVKKGQEDIPTSQSFDIKGTSYQTSYSDPAKETIKVRAFQIVDGERVYGAWSVEKTVYFNGMTAQTTTAVKSTTKSSTTTAKASTTTAANGKTESPKTGDNSHAALICAVSAMITAIATRKKKK